MDRSARSCDLLEPDALFQTAKLLQTHSDADFIYSEEDKFSEEGFAAPMLKPDWSPDFFLACNYLCHFLPNSMARRITISFSAPSSGPIGFITFRGCCIIGGKAQAPARVAFGKNPGNSKPVGAPLVNTSDKKASEVTSPSTGARTLIGSSGNLPR